MTRPRYRLRRAWWAARPCGHRLVLVIGPHDYRLTTADAWASCEGVRCAQARARALPQI